MFLEKVDDCMKLGGWWSRHPLMSKGKTIMKNEEGEMDGVK